MFVKKIIFVAISACLLAVCSWIAIPYVVPFTMQTFAVFCILLMFGGKFGTISLVLYILMGCIGLPVFSGFSGGIGHILSPTGGYVIGFLITAVCYWCFEKTTEKCRNLKIPVLILGLLLCYLIGSLWYFIMFSKGENKITFFGIVSICVLPYVIPDILKMLLAYFVAGRVKKVLPDIYK